MTTKSQQPKGSDSALSLLGGAIEAIDLAKENSRITQAEAAFGSVSTLLAIIKVNFLLVHTDQPLTNVVRRKQ